MCFARRLLVFVLMATAAMAFTAGAATAQETEVEVVDEANGHEACVPCDLHAEGESHIFSLVAGAEVLTCEDEYDAVVYHDGSGEIEWTGTAHGGFGCNILNCQSGDEGHWPMIGPVGEIGGEVEHFTLRFCLRNAGTGVEFHCEGEVSILDTDTAHIYELFATIVDTINCPGRRFELHAVTEYVPSDGDDNVEFEHHVEP